MRVPAVLAKMLKGKGERFIDKLCVFDGRGFRVLSFDLYRTTLINSVEIIEWLKIIINSRKKTATACSILPRIRTINAATGLLWSLSTGNYFQYQFVDHYQHLHF